MERSRAWRVLAIGLIAALGWTALGCGSRKPKGPSREQVTALLQKEAAAIKAGGEGLDPALGVRATWTLLGIVIREQPQNADNPWAGTVTFKIRAEMRDMDSVSVNESERRFEYVWSQSPGLWLPAPSR